MKKYLFLLLIIQACTNYDPKVLSEKEYLAYGNKLVKAIKLKNNKTIENQFNLADTFEQLEHQIDSSKLRFKTPKKILNTYKGEINQDFSVYVEALLGLINKDAIVEVTKYYTIEEHPHIIILVYSSIGYDIVDFELKTIGKQTFITNYLSYNTGIDFSESFVWNAINFLEYGKYKGEYNVALSELKNANDYMEIEEPENAWIAINRVPEEFLYHSNFQMVRNTIALTLSDSLYAESMYDWIGYNWDMEGFRYLKAMQFYTYFEDSIEAANYFDSLKMIVGNNSILNKLKEVN